MFAAIMNQNTSNQDYAASDISELARRQGGAGNDPLRRPTASADQTTRTVARRLLSACIVVPGVLWFVTFVGVRLQWYGLATASLLFVCSVTAAFGAIVWFNVTKLSRLDEQRAQAQEQLKLAKDAAEAANRFKSMFFANISHEIRTPLTAINGFAELLLNSERTADQRLSDARVIRRNGEHLLTLINDILDLSKIEAGKMSVDRILCCPAKAIGEVVSLLRPRAVEKGLTLDVTFEGQIPKQIQTDPMRLRQVLINLVANAIKFTKEGGVKLSVSIKPELRAEKPLLEVRIADTGIGIPTQQQAALFQPFVQGDASITRQYGGSGLGLAISQHFARALGGDIALTSEPGRGSTFTVTVGTGSLLNAEVHHRPELAMDTQDNFTGPRVRIAGSVLVAEDGLDNQALILAKLQETGLSVEIVSNGQLACEKALAAVESGKPYDVILMDVQMPVMDGFAATLYLRGKGYRGPVIALTANAMERDRTKCLNAGCNDFVTKPIKSKELFKAIGRYLKVEEIAPQPALFTKDAPAATPSRAARAQQFYQMLPAELAQMEQAVEREDRVRLKEIAQLLLGTAAAAGLKDLAPQIAKLLMSAESERSWLVLRQSVAEFARDAQPKVQSQAA
jgi:signal transduction histidine kinase/DNA-binding response OmpR family regulator